MNPDRSLLTLLSRRWLICLLGLIPASASFATPPPLQTQNVFLITTDGLRPSELFTGADPTLLNVETGGFKNEKAVAQTRAAYWRETPEARREALMPFFWSVVAKQGQVFGNQAKGSSSQVTNGKKFSYAGYNEMLTGWTDPAIMNNDPIPNPNVTVFEWLNAKPAFKDRVAVFSAWSIIPFIVNRERCHFPIMGGWEPLPEKPRNGKEELLNALIAECTRTGHPTEVFDPFLYYAAVEHMLARKPRVMMFSFLETDYWGHQGRYDWLLDSAHRFDDYLRRLWELAQSMPEYAGKTTFIITTDHGRGSGPDGWKRHGVGVEGAEHIWMAYLGPDTAPLGERTHCAPVVQAQTAATLAAFLGENYPAEVPKAAPPIAEVLGLDIKATTTSQ